MINEKIAESQPPVKEKDVSNAELLKKLEALESRLIQIEEKLFKPLIS